MGFKSSVLTSSTFDNLSDEELIEAYKSLRGDDYFEEIYRRYSQKIYAKSMSLFKNSAQAEDATHEIFIKILLNLSKFKGNSKFSTWIYSITYNYCIDFIRKNRRRRNTISVEDNPNIISEMETNNDIEDKKLKEIRLDRLENVMDKINSLDRSILMMKYMDNLSMKDIGAILGKSESATKMRILRAKQKFKQKYNTIYNDEF